MIKIFSTFTGIGSFEVALRNIGVPYENMGTSDVDRHAIVAYDALHNSQEPVERQSKEYMLNVFSEMNIAYNFSTGKSEIPKKEEDIRILYEAHVRNKNHGDIRKIKVEELDDFNLFTYSFPCKNVSTQGKQAGFVKDSGTQTSLVWEAERIIAGKRPEYLIMENVKGITSDVNMQLFDTWIETLENLGYNSYYDVLNAENFELPQHRERFMMVSIRKDIDKRTFYMPKNRRNNKIVNLIDILEEEVDEKYSLRENSVESINKIVNNLKEQGKYESILNDTKRFKGIKIVGLVDYEKFSSKKRIFHAYGLSPTLDSKSGVCLPKVFIKGEIRYITPIEAWRIMGYTDEDFYKVRDIGKLSYDRLHERAGRAIAIPMLEEIFKNLFFEPKKIGLFF